MIVRPQFHDTLRRLTRTLAPAAHAGAVLLAVAMFGLLAACERKPPAKDISSMPSRAATWAGTETCRPCHFELYQGFKHTGMGRSFGRIDSALVAPLVAAAGVVHEPQSDFSYSVRMAGGRLFMREFRQDEAGRLHFAQERPAAYQIGSGNHTLSFIENRNGYLFEMPLTYYSLKKLWDMSPGYRANNWRFDRPISATCMNCHNAPTAVTPQTENHFAQVPLSIGCENCHGPASEHVAIARQGHFSTQGVINPIALSRDLQMDICQRCHLEGLSVWNDRVTPEQVQIGRPLAAFKAVFVQGGAHESEHEFGIASQADRLRKSACFQKSGTLTCTTCHDPHESPRLSGREEFNGTCRGCHNSPGEVQCGMAAAPAQDCVGCHMKAGGTRDIPHVHFTDHYIRKLPAAAEAANRSNLPAVPPLLPMLQAGEPAEQLMQRGLAYFQFHQTMIAEPAYLDSAIALLTAAKRQQTQRQDGEDDYALGGAYFLKGQLALAEDALREAVRRNPKHGRAYYVLGNVLLPAQRHEEALQAFALGQQAQPLFLENYLGLAQAQMASGSFDAAAANLAQVIAQDSLSFPEAFYYYGQIAHNRREFAAARSFYRRALARNPDMILAWLNTGATHIFEQNWRAAIACFDAILQRFPDHVPALMNKAVCLLNLGEKKAARTIVNRVLTLEPHNQNAQNLLAELAAR